MRGTGYRVRPCGRKFNSRNDSGPTDFDEIWYWKEAMLRMFCEFNPKNRELNPTYLLALLGAYHFLHVSRIRVKLLTFRRLTSYIYGAPILDVSRSHTTKQHSR
jgi:hypothetical protein